MWFVRTMTRSCLVAGAGGRGAVGGWRKRRSRGRRGAGRTFSGCVRGLANRRWRCGRRLRRREVVSRVRAGWADLSVRAVADHRRLYSECAMADSIEGLYLRVEIDPLAVCVAQPKTPSAVGSGSLLHRAVFPSRHLENNQGARIVEGNNRVRGQVTFVERNLQSGRVEWRH